MNIKPKLSCALIVSLCVPLLCIVATALVVPSEDVRPNLVVTGITIPILYQDCRCTIEVTVENIGECNITTPFNVSLKISEIEIANKTIHALFAGGTSIVNFTWVPPSTGYYDLTVLVDPDCDLYESDEENNNLTREVHVVEHVPIELRSPRGGEIWEDTSNTFTIYNTGSAEAWEGFHANAGFSLSTAPDSANCAWAAEVGANPSSSVCIADGKVIVFCTEGDKGWVTALDENNGGVLWKSDKWDWNYGSWATPAYSNGKVYMMGSGYISAPHTYSDPMDPCYIRTFALYTIDANNGNTTAKHYLVNKTDVEGFPVNGGVLVAYGTQFFSTYDDGLYYRVGDTVDPPSPPSDVKWYSPEPQGWDWRFDVGGIAQSTPAAAVGLGKIYFGDYSDAGGDGTLYCVEQSTGNLAWKKKLESGLCGSPTVANGNVYLTTYGFYDTPSGTYAFDASTGNLTWNKIWANNKRPSDSTPAYAPFDDGYVYVAGGGWSDSPYVVCFDDRNGSIVWDNDKSNFDQWINDSSQYEDGESFGVGHWTNSPVVSIDGKVFVGKPAGKDVANYEGLFCLDAKTGKERWHSDYGGSTAAIANGRVYTTGGGMVYAFGPEERPDLIPKDIAVVYPPAYEGLANLINVTVENIGNEDAGDFDVSLGYEDVEIGTASVSSLARKTHTNVVFEWTPPAAGNYTLQVTVNSDMRVNEPLFNNKMNKDVTVLPTPPADIAVTDITYSSPVLTDKPCTISAVIINYGVSTSDFYVSLTADGNPVGLPIHIPDLDFGAPKSVDFTWTPSASGNYTLTVFADCKNTTIESDETNNKKSIQVTAIAELTEPQMPFVVGGCVSDADGDPCNGSYVRITNNETGESWDARNESKSNYYQLVITSDDVGNGTLLRFAVAYGSKSAAVAYNVTQAEVNAGGFSLDITIGQLPGDVNGDDEVTAADAVIMLRMAVCGEYLKVADVNGDMSVTSLDALMIMGRTMG